MGREQQTFVFWEGSKGEPKKRLRGRLRHDASDAMRLLAGAIFAHARVSRRKDYLQSKFKKE